MNCVLEVMGVEGAGDETLINTTSSTKKAKGHNGKPEAPIEDASRFPKVLEAEDVDGLFHAACHDDWRFGHVLGMCVKANWGTRKGEETQEPSFANKNMERCMQGQAGTDELYKAMDFLCFFWGLGNETDRTAEGATSLHNQHGDAMSNVGIVTPIPSQVEEVVRVVQTAR